MDRITAEKIFELQERFLIVPENQELIAELHSCNTRFLQALESMTPQQRDAVMDYFGVGIEIYLRLLQQAVQ